jgi:hypothetical protein
VVDTGEEGVLLRIMRMEKEEKVERRGDLPVE